MWSVAAGDYPAAELEAAWKKLLLNQFHDILPGSSIDWVYEETERDLAHVVEAADAVADRATRLIAGDGDRVAIFNSTSHPRSGAPPCGFVVVDKPPEVSTRSMENEFLRVEW